MRRARGRAGLRPAEPGSEVTTLELFFDLVFVFTITQLTSVVHGSDGPGGYLRAAAVLCVTWWMYDGYAWLSNNVGPTDASTRLPMLVAMTGFLVMAVTTPDAFGDGAWAFAIAYLVVVVVHSAQFLRSSLGDSALAVSRIAPVNLLLAGLLIAAAAAPAANGWLWGAAFGVLVFSVLRRSETGFDLRTAHFAERHRLVVIIALGETVVAVGIGAEGRLDDRHLSVVAALLLAVVLLTSLWWAYFGGDADRGATALEAAPPERKARLALIVYGLAHLGHVAGLILLATGLEEVVAHPTEALDSRLAWTMCAGCAAFLLSEAGFVRALAIGPAVPLVVAAVVCLPTALLGGALAAWWELAGLAAVVVALLVVRPRYH